MEKSRLFETALGITDPRHIELIEFDPELKQLNIHINFQRGTTFPSTVCDGEYKAHDTKSKTWRHLNFFEHECYPHCRTPRIKTKSGKNAVVDLRAFPFEDAVPMSLDGLGNSDDRFETTVRGPKIPFLKQMFKSLLVGSVVNILETFPNPHGSDSPQIQFGQTCFLKFGPFFFSKAVGSHLELENWFDNSPKMIRRGNEQAINVKSFRL